MGRHVLKTPVRTPQANAFCERLIGTMRRECLDWLIPIHEGHLRWILREWVTHYNRGRPHASLGPGIPQPFSERKQIVSTGHRLPEGGRVIETVILDFAHLVSRLGASCVDHQDTPRDHVGVIIDATIEQTLQY